MWSMEESRGTTTQEHNETGVELSNNERVCGQWKTVEAQLRRNMTKQVWN